MGTSGHESNDQECTKNLSHRHENARVVMMIWVEVTGKQRCAVSSTEIWFQDPSDARTYGCSRPLYEILCLHLTPTQPSMECVQLQTQNV